MEAHTGAAALDVITNFIAGVQPHATPSQHSSGIAAATNQGGSLTGSVLEPQGSSAAVGADLISFDEELGDNATQIPPITGNATGPASATAPSTALDLLLNDSLGPSFVQEEATAAEVPDVSHLVTLTESRSSTKGHGDEAEPGLHMAKPQQPPSASVPSIPADNAGGSGSQPVLDIAAVSVEAEPSRTQRVSESNEGSDSGFGDFQDFQSASAFMPRTTNASVGVPGSSSGSGAGEDDNNPGDSVSVARSASTSSLQKASRSRGTPGVGYESADPASSRHLSQGQFTASMSTLRSGGSSGPISPPRPVHPAGSLQQPGPQYNFPGHTTPYIPTLRGPPRASSAASAHTDIADLSDFTAPSEAATSRARPSVASVSSPGGEELFPNDFPNEFQYAEDHEEQYGLQYNPDHHDAASGGALGGADSSSGLAGGVQGHSRGHGSGSGGGSGSMRDRDRFDLRSLHSATNSVTTSVTTAGGGDRYERSSVAASAALSWNAPSHVAPSLAAPAGAEDDFGDFTSDFTSTSDFTVPSTQPPSAVAVSGPGSMHHDDDFGSFASHRSTAGDDDDDFGNFNAAPPQPMPSASAGGAGPSTSTAAGGSGGSGSAMGLPLPLPLAGPSAASFFFVPALPSAPPSASTSAAAAFAALPKPPSAGAAAPAFGPHDQQQQEPAVSNMPAAPAPAPVPPAPAPPAAPASDARGLSDLEGSEYKAAVEATLAPLLPAGVANLQVLLQGALPASLQAGVSGSPAAGQQHQHLQQGRELLQAFTAMAQQRGASSEAQHQQQQGSVLQYNGIPVSVIGGPGQTGSSGAVGGLLSPGNRMYEPTVKCPWPLQWRGSAGERRLLSALGLSLVAAQARLLEEQQEAARAARRASLSMSSRLHLSSASDLQRRFMANGST